MYIRPDCLLLGYASNRRSWVNGVRFPFHQVKEVVLLEDWFQVLTCNANASIVMFFDAVESELVNLVKKNDTLVVIGETGSGKTTRQSTKSFSHVLLSLKCQKVALVVTVFYIYGVVFRHVKIQILK